MWVGGGIGAFYLIQDTGTAKLKRKMEEEGRLDKNQDKKIAAMMEKLRSSPTTLSECREISTKQRRKMAEEATVYAIQPESEQQSGGSKAEK